MRHAISSVRTAAVAANALLVLLLSVVLVLRCLRICLSVSVAVTRMLLL
jgi:hypothetical protein